jgi:ribosomal protein S13
MGTSHETTVPPLGEGLTFEKVWASLMELKESQKETAQQIKAMNAETAQQIKAMSTETDRMFKETAQQIKAISAETARQMKETDKRIGEITNRFGDMVEHMVVPNLVAKFRELDFTFTKVSRDMKITDENNRILAEVDAFLENGDQVMVVEIKTKPTIRDINDQIERMKKLRCYADVRHDRRRYLGAIAGVVMSESVKTYALKKGLYVLEPSGETFIITEPQAQGYSPQEW